MKFVPVPGTKALFSIWHTRVQDYAAFAKAQEAAGKKVDGSWKTQQKDGVPVGREADHPVVGVSWDDAQAFCQWLTAKETAEGKLTKGAKYRLPTDAEWSTAAGMPPEPGATPEEKHSKNSVDFPWGKTWPPNAGNYADESFHARFPFKQDSQDPMISNGWITGYNDGFATTSPVGSFPANAHGLHDMGGNVWQWSEDWSNSEHTNRVLRGASWGQNGRGSLLSSDRAKSTPTYRSYYYGFRVVLAPAPSTAAVSPSPSLPVSSSPSSATKAAPFTNTLGMKFVPVPITGGPTDKQRVLFSIWETRVQDYEVFAKEAKRKWAKPDFEQAATHPAVMVSWEDAQAFCAWMTEKERKAGKVTDKEVYRLPSDHEWSCAVGIGAREDAAKLPVDKTQLVPGVYPWGTTWPAPAVAANVWSDELNALVDTYKLNRPGATPPRQDGHAFTAPVGSYQTNSLGLHDLGGNVREWAADWYDATRQHRVARGGCWAAADHGNLLSSFRLHFLAPNQSKRDQGFRCVLELAPSTAAVSSSPNLPVSKSSDPKFPPGQWVKLFTKAEDLPADLRRPDSGVTWEDGWIRNAKSAPSTLPLPRSLVGNIGVRFHQQASWKEGKLAATLYLKNGPASDGPASYMMQINSRGEMQVQKGVGEQKFLPVAVRPLPPSHMALYEIDVEYAIAGDRIVTRAGGTELMVAQEAISKEAPGHLNLYTAIRDIEVINLDGLPEAEALRLLGVDEQGNDLRGKTGAAK